MDMNMSGVRVGVEVLPNGIIVKNEYTTFEPVSLKFWKPDESSLACSIQTGDEEFSDESDTLDFDKDSIGLLITYLQGVRSSLK